jgi:hypothetical protein
MAIVLYESGLLNKVGSNAVDLSDRFIEATSKGCFNAYNFPAYERNYEEYRGNAALKQYFITQMTCIAQCLSLRNLLLSNSKI